MDNGVFIVLEGADGSGKATQFRLLSARLRAMGYEVAVFDFPRYDQPSSHFVKKYLNGEYGPAGSVNPYTASLFYALDRYEAAPDIRAALAAGKIVLSNRFVGSNMAHQGSKFGDQIEQRGFFVWEDNLEFELLNIPRPNLNLFLRVPAEISFELISKKAKRPYLTQAQDEHEKDLDHLKHSVQTYDTLCQLFPKDFKPIECSEAGKLLSIPEINDRIWTTIKPLLPANPPHPARGLTVKLSEDSFQEEKPEKQAKAAGLAATVKDNSLHYGFDSLSNLAVSDLSLAGAKIQLAAEPWAKTKNKSYFVPAKLSKEVQADYVAGMDKLARLHGAMHKKLSLFLDKNGSRSKETYEILAAVVPLAAQCSGSAVIDKDVCVSMLRTERTALPELRAAYKDIKNKAGSLWADDFKQKIQPDDAATITKLANELSPNLATEPEEVRILQAWPRQEFELLADALYSYSNLAREYIIAAIENWTYQRKYQALRVALKDAGLDVIQRAKYRIDTVLDRVTLNDLAASGILDDMQIQAATPRYGYQVPKITEEAAIEDMFMDCFDESLKIYSLLQETSTSTAAYATLMGHKVRAQFTISAASIRNYLDGTKNSARHEDFLNQIVQKLSELHPILSEVIILPANTPTHTEQPKKTGQRRSRRGSRSKKP